MIFVSQSVSDNNIGAKTFHAFNQEGFQYLVYPLRMQPETVLVAPTGTILALYCTVLVVVCFSFLWPAPAPASALFCWLDPYLYCNVLVAPAVFCWQLRFTNSVQADSTQGVDFRPVTMYRPADSTAYSFKRISQMALSRPLKSTTLVLIKSVLFLFDNSRMKKVERQNTLFSIIEVWCSGKTERTTHCLFWYNTSITTMGYSVRGC